MARLVEKFPGPVLLLDTAFEQGVVCIANAGTVVAEVYLPNKLDHGKELCEAIQSCLRRASLNMQDLHGIGVGRGPGSFVGLRVALAQAKGMALALQIPLFGVCTMLALLRSAKVEHQEALVSMKAGRALYFEAAFFNENAAVASYLAGPMACEEPLKRWNGDRQTLITNEGSLPEGERHIVQGPSGLGLYSAFLERLLSESVQDEMLTLTPRYLKAPSATPNFRALVQNVSA